MLVSVTVSLGGLLVCLVAGSFAASPSQPLRATYRPASGGIPIHAWIGPPADQTTPQRYRELAEAGFTHSFSGFPDAEAVAAALEIAHQAGVKLIISLPELKRGPEAIVRRFKDHPALGGYHLTDEPGASKFPKLAEWARRIQKLDPSDEHFCYINLLPTYAAPHQQLECETYQEYVDRFLDTVPVEVLSFDHYPVCMADGRERLRADWYHNLEIISAAAAKRNMPFWAFALAVALEPHPIAEPAHLRVQVFSNLAYGAQGIQYFTYWTPGKNPIWDFHDAPIGLDGKRSVVYERVRQVNREIRGLSSVFAGGEVLSVGHTGDEIPRGTRRYEPAEPITALRTRGSGAVVSTLANAGRRYLLVVNRDLHELMPLEITWEEGARLSQISKDGSAEQLPGNGLQTAVGPGDICLLAWAGT